MNSNHMFPICGILFAAYGVAAGLLIRRHKLTGKPSMETMRRLRIAGIVILAGGVSAVAFAH